MDMLDLYARSSAWTLAKATEAVPVLDAPTPCDQWDVRSLLNHLLQTQQYFVASARGEEASPPVGEPPALLGPDPVADLRRVRAELLEIFADDSVRERTGPALGIAFADQLLHGWDLAVAGGGDRLMPNGLPEVAFEVVHGAFTDEQRAGVFGPEIEVPQDASAQDRLLAYSGRTPA